MIKKCRWQGLYYNSTEECSIETSADKIVIKSSITGEHKKTTYHANYTIKTDSSWHTVSFEVECSFNKTQHRISGVHEKSGWMINNQFRKEFSSCIDVDITLTPLTNTLPINRLSLPIDQSRQIDILYINVFENKVYPVKQQYTRKTETIFNFQNVPNDFEADITVDADGYVTNYPKLFKRLKL